MERKGEGEGGGRGREREGEGEGGGDEVSLTSNCSSSYLSPIINVLAGSRLVLDRWRDRVYTHYPL